MTPEEYKEDYEFTYKMRKLKYMRELGIVALCIIAGISLLSFVYIKNESEDGFYKASLGSPPTEKKEITIIHKGPRTKSESVEIKTLVDSIEKAESDCEECEEKRIMMGEECVSVDCIKEPERCRKLLGLKPQL